MLDIRQIALEETSPNQYWQTCQTILSLVEMILRFCLVFMKYTSSNCAYRMRTRIRLKSNMPNSFRENIGPMVTLKPLVINCFNVIASTGSKHELESFHNGDYCTNEKKEDFFPEFSNCTFNSSSVENEHKRQNSGEVR